jgi:hypothetical protein
MAYLGNLTCRDCGLTFTSRWGSVTGADEYRCGKDHIVLVHPDTAMVLAVEGYEAGGATLVDLRGACPVCGSELLCGRLPRCPVCGSRDHEVAVEGTL